MTPSPPDPHGAPPAPPTQPGGPAPASPAARPAKGGFRLLTFGVALLALLISLVAAVQSERAVDKAGKALAAAGAGARGTTTETAPAATATTDAGVPETTTEAAPETSGTAPSLNAQTQYKQRYADQTLRISSNCNEAVDIDVDEPRVQVADTIAELVYSWPCGAAAPQITLPDGVGGSEVDTDSVTPADCADRIRTSPLLTGAHPLRRGQVYCLNTSRTAANSAAITWKMVVLKVTATNSDGTVTFSASAWDIPA